jgi:glutamate synthase domain-containing protein 1
VWNSTLEEKRLFYVPSLSHRTIVYKGMLNAVLDWIKNLI